MKILNSNKQVLKPLISNANRGMHLEMLINETNKEYVKRGIAVIYKKPTPIQIVKVSYPSRSHAKITEAYYKTPSTTDYNGVYEGFYIDFDVKETMSKTSFPLSNIKPHQIEHLKNIDKAKGIGFLIISFKSLNKFYLLTYKDLSYFIERSMICGKKSISLDEFKMIGYEITLNYPYILDYLEIVKKIIGQTIR